MIEENALVAARTKFWPSPQDYNEAMQFPAQSFADPELAAAEAVCNRFGIPRPSTGMFASVYQFCRGESAWAVRCFLRNYDDHKLRYNVISQKLLAERFSFAVQFDFQEKGVLVNGTWFPILKMEWCAGELLHVWVGNNLHNSEALGSLALKFKQMLQSLSRAGIAHGDLQHGNILVAEGEIKLVDYDGMYLPELAELGSHELGHRNYQHPLRNAGAYNADLDSFSAWLIYLSLICLSLDPSIWERVGAGDECLLFRQQDLLEPESSATFGLLNAHENPDIRLCVWILRSLLACNHDEIWHFASAPGGLGALFEYCGRPDLERIITLPEWMENGNLEALQLGSPKVPGGALQNETGQSLALADNPLAEPDPSAPGHRDLVLSFPSQIGQLVDPAYCLADPECPFTFQILDDYYKTKSMECGRSWLIALLMAPLVIASMAMRQPGIALFLVVMAAAISPPLLRFFLRSRLLAAARALKYSSPQKIRIMRVSPGTVDYSIDSLKPKYQNLIEPDAYRLLTMLDCEKEYLAYVNQLFELVALINDRELLLVMGRAPADD